MWMAQIHFEFPKVNSDGSSGVHRTILKLGVFSDRRKKYLFQRITIIQTANIVEDIHMVR